MHANIAAQGRLKRSLDSESTWGVLFILPAVIGFIVFIAFPIGMSFYYSLTKFDGIITPKYIGFANYQTLFTNKRFYNSLWNTIYFSIGTVPTGTLLSLIAAVALNRKMRMMKFYRTAFFMPVVVSLVSISMVWQWMYQKDYGIINTALGALNLYQPPWLGSKYWAMPALWIMTVWKNLGFNAILFLAGLQGISPSIYESAALDGANAVQKFRYITLPLISHTTTFVLINSLIKAFQTFDTIYIMTSGGPSQSTEVISFLIYTNAFSYYKQGLACAMAYVLFVIIFAFTMIRILYKERREA